MNFKRLLQNILLVFVSLLIALGAVEIALHIWHPFPFRVKGDTVILPRNMDYVIHVPTEDGGERIVRHHKNSLGFRGPELPAQAGNYLTILTVGGSTTEEFYLPDGVTWPDLMARGLERHLSGIWVNNAGLDGHSTFGHYILIRDYLLKLKPNVVILLVGINDVGVDYPNSFDRRNRQAGLDFSSWNGFIVSVANSSEVGGVVLNLYRVWMARNMGVTHQFNGSHSYNYNEGRLTQAEIAAWTKHIDGFRARLEAIVDLLDRAGVMPVLITQPADYAPPNDQPGPKKWQLLEMYNDVTRNLAVDSGISFVDLARRLPRAPGLFYDEIHFNERGAQEVARIVIDALCPVLAEKYPQRVIRACELSDSLPNRSVPEMPKAGEHHR